MHNAATIFVTKSDKMHRTVLAIHGGAGTLLKEEMTAEKETKYLAALEAALLAGNAILKNGGTAEDAVTAAVISMEDSPLLNAGRGSVFTANGTHEMDAAIMTGQNTNCGAVCGVTGIKNPISLARAVMNHSEHVLLATNGAETFAKEVGAEFKPPEYFYDELRFNQWQKVKGSETFALDHDIDPDRKFGTVGAVALDVHGNIAAATSTGGMTNKRFGRVGDSPLIGAGTYANNATCAVSCTGSGEYFIRAVAAYEVSALMEFKDLSLKDACEEVIHDRLLKIGGDGGLIAVDTKGNVSMPFNTAGMYRGFIREGEPLEISIYGDRS